jgi:uncharacterized protein
LESATSPLSGPTQPNERVPLLDAIRGVALGGILLANLMSFFGADMVPAASRRAMPAGPVGERVLFGVNWLVEGKFYSIFSMLLGVGFALQATRAERRGWSPERFAGFFQRRMGVLVGIGLLHMYGLWAGDILTLYGIMGLLLPALARAPEAARIAAMAALFAVPLATHAVVLVSDGRYDPRPPFAAMGAEVGERLGVAGRSSIEVFARGTAADYSAWNASFAVVRPGTYLQSGRPAKVLALFVLGAWLGRSVLPRLEALRYSLYAVILAGGLVGFASSYLYATIKAATGSTFLVSGAGLVQTAAYTFGTTPLALAYMAAAAVAWRSGFPRRVLEWFIPLGRMALSVYLSQTIVLLAIFTGCGLGLAGRVPFAWLPCAAAGVLVTQRALCVWWLRRHAHGPVEWMWRRAIYDPSTHRVARTADVAPGAAHEK